MKNVITIKQEIRKEENHIVALLDVEGQKLRYKYRPYGWAFPAFTSLSLVVGRIENAHLSIETTSHAVAYEYNHAPTYSGPLLESLRRSLATRGNTAEITYNPDIHVDYTPTEYYRPAAE